MRYKSIELRKKELYKDSFRDPSYDRTFKSLKTGSSHMDTSKNESSLNTHQSLGSNQLPLNQNYNQKIRNNKVSKLNQSINMPGRIQIQDLKQNTTNNYNS